MSKFFRVFFASILILYSCSAISKTYRIGVLVPLTGPSAEKGIPLKNAVELFVEQFNASSQKNGTKLEIFVRDDFDDPERARVVATEMVKEDSLVAVIGHYYPTTALATAKVFGDAKIPFLSPNVSSPAFLDANKWMFSVNLPDDIQGGFMAVYIKEVLKKDNVLLIHNTDAFGVSLREAFSTKAARIGLNVKKIISVDGAGVPADWASKNLPDQVGDEKFGVVAALTHSGPGLKLLPQLRNHGVAAPVMAPNTWSNPKFFTDIDEKYTAEVYVTSPFLWEIATHEASQFARSYEKRFGERPVVAAAMAYDATLLLSHALQSIQGPGSDVPATRAIVREFMAKIDWHHAIEGATGNLFFSKSDDRTSEFMAKFNADANQAKVAVSNASKAVSTESGPAAIASTRAVSEKQAKKTGAAEGAQPENRAAMRNALVSVMKDGRFKVAAIQLLRPREDYVLKQLSDRVKKGYVTISDDIPYHIVDVVFVGVDVIKINDVNIKDMLWDVDVFMWFKWAGTRLEVKDIEKIGAINSVKEVSVLLKEDLNQATKYRAYRKRLTLGAPYNLSAFPFDAQSLPMSIAHANKNSTHVMLVLDSRHMESSPVKDIKPEEWRYVGRNVFSDLHKYESTFGDPDYRMGTNYKSPIYFSTVNLEIGIKRILSPYLYTFFLPLTIILGIILLILWVPLDQFAPRINASISGLVGILVYHMSQKNSFPKVGYTMVADYYFLAAYALVVSMIICIILTQTLMSKGQKDEAKAWNKRISIGAALAAVSVYSFMTLASM